MISSNQNERVKYWYSLQDKKNRDANKEYIVEGEHLVQEAYKNGYLKTLIYIDGFIISNYYDVEHVEVNESVMKKISSTQTPQKVAGVVSYFNNDIVDIKENRVVLLDGVQDPGNAGTIVRNSLAFGYNIVYFSNNSVDIYNPKFIRATQGYFYSLKLIRDDLINLLNYLNKNNYQLICTYLSEESINLKDFIPNEKHCLIFGNEGQGVSKDSLNVSNAKIIIKMNEKVDSLNVAIASGIVMYDFDNKLKKN